MRNEKTLVMTGGSKETKENIMRVIFELTKEVDMKPITGKPSDIYNEKIQKTYNYVAELYDNNKTFKNKYNKIIHLIHPYDDIYNSVKSEYISGTPKMTNAFMKQYEFLTWLDTKGILNELIMDNNLRMFDIASPPGMFVLATETYLRKNYSNTILDWHTSIFNEGDQNIDLKMDEYELFRSNTDRVMVMNLLDDNDVNNVIQTHSNTFDIVTGDVGTERKNYYELLELTTYPLELSQAITAINLNREGGVCFLKMFTCITYNTLNILELMNKYYDKVYICKPYTSRLINEESYIIGIGRNDIKYSKPDDEFYSYNINNKIIVENFENKRNNLKLKILHNIIMNMEKNKNIKEDSTYMEFYHECRFMMNIIKNL